MKKLTFLIAFFGLIMNANGQSFTMDKDTSKKYWSFAGYNLEPHILFINTTSAGITFNWKMSYFYRDDNWRFDGACDNVLCYTDDISGLKDGTRTFVSNSVKPGDTLDFKMTFNGNDAANFTKSLGTIEIWTGTEPSKKATFAAYKGTTGINTVILKDEISIFPNPASNYIDVIYPASSDVKTIAIYNLIGKVVNVYKVTDKNNARCEFGTDMPAGIYIVRIADSKENVVATRKITQQ